MPTDAQNTPYPPALELKSSTFSVPVLVLASNDLIDIGLQLQKKTQQAPDFFKNSPIVVDVQWLNKNQLDIDIDALFALIRKSGVLPIGIRGGNGLQNQQALALGIPLHPIHNTSTEAKKTAEPPPSAVAANAPLVAAPPHPATLITHPVRSGQRVYAEGDLIILSAVSAGAEIMAEGNIHVYGSLRGRAMAGVQGNVDARIFCSALEAELISIAGTYKISDDIRGVAPNRPVQIYLQENTLVIKYIA